MIATTNFFNRLNVSTRQPARRLELSGEILTTTELLQVWVLVSHWA